MHTQDSAKMIRTNRSNYFELLLLRPAYLALRFGRPWSRNFDLGNQQTLPGQRIFI